MLHRLRRPGLGLLLLILPLSPCLGAEEESERPSDETPALEDVIVVTGSRVEEKLREVPATVTVITGEELATSSATTYGDVLRTVPGLNVSQISARDVQINGRGASGALSGDQLVLLDSRSVYLDFFGFVMWDLLPVDLRELAQVEVMRGPGSAVWGANAVGGVVNLITKSPWELQGTKLRVGGGELGTLYGGGSYARASESWGFKGSASYYQQDPYDRPTGLIPGTETPYPAFENEGTRQPKADLRVDRDLGEGSALSFSGGWAGTDGIVHSGIGPFDVDNGSTMSYLQGSWNHEAFEVRAYANVLDGEATNLISLGLDGLPLTFGFASETYHLEARDHRVLGPVGVTYGASARRTSFDLSIAPAEDQRDEVGVFAQADVELGPKFRWVLGARWDDVDPIGSVVSPRTGLTYSPSPEHTFRISYNRAFRAPALIETYIDTAVLSTIDFSELFGFPFVYSFPTASVGNPDLEEEKLTAYELSYLGTLDDGRTTIGVSLYRNELEGAIDYAGSAYYSSANPPPGWPLPAYVLDSPALAGVLPAEFTYLNIGKQIDRGVELSVDYRPNSDWRLSFAYSLQDTPDVEGVALEEVNLPPRIRTSLGGTYHGSSWYVDGMVQYVEKAFWSDVLDARYHGWTDPYTLVNATFGYRLPGDRIEVALIGSNLLDQDIQQHVFGDVLSRRVVAEVRFAF